MNWIIQKTEKLEFHTDLKELLKPIQKEIEYYNWVISDFEFISDKELPIHHEEDFFVLSSQEFNDILNSQTQFIWGIICGFPKDQEIIVNENNIPFAEENDLIWKNENFQIPNSSIEIIAFDSSYTIIKFKEKNLSNTFKRYFIEAIKLEDFNS
ncbi:hypothetical protein [Flavobacterium quisquiliarum]|uniref:Uncharacterized protein n=1 Tax=Flavobacterium quisquiliarum TaxID=1834436 RepID=A0ABV8W3H8_9FLAO|nr:hypothetical protein [Flavobacterium quisquiliarum]MBW1656954.1 hypothetical protein [Flavobacterium quisquiliarum]NWK99619.1 hypothetical protein [Flavobacterium collinsii]